MKAHLYKISQNQIEPSVQTTGSDVQLVLAFGSKERIAEPLAYQILQTAWPSANIILCSTAGEIIGTEVHDDSIVVCAMSFDKTNMVATEIDLCNVEDSRAAGVALAHTLYRPDLSYVLLLSDGEKVNGSALIEGINEVYKGKIPVTGGLAGDGSKFKSTLVGLNRVPESGKIAGVGFYGPHIKIGHGSLGGWDVFGIERTITKSQGNVLYEIDDTNALAIYKDYLGKYAHELPGSALLFPLSITLQDNDQPVVRTILSIDDERQCLTFAGDVPVGAKARLMKSNFDRLIDAASQAAEATFTANLNTPPQLALLISCVGRKIILKHRVEEEVEAVSEVFGDQTPLIGFYSYGELSPFNPGSKCQLHNQTMTITTFLEI